MGAFSFIDKISEVEKDQSITAFFTLKGTEEFLKDHFEDFPVMPSLGNHDIRADANAAPYFRRFPELHDSRYYSFDHKDLHFVSVNSNELAPTTETG